MKSLLWLSLLLPLVSLPLVACDEIEELFDPYGTHQVATYSPPDVGGPTSSGASGTRLHREVGR